MEWLLGFLALLLLAASGARRVSPANRTARTVLWVAAPLVLVFILVWRFIWSPDFWRTLAASNWQPAALIVVAALLGIFWLAGGWRRE